jgi:CubicO group peptidase (beta-lactamase class C family)
MKTWFFCFLATALIAPGMAGAQSLADDPRVASAIQILENWLDTEVDYKDIPAITVGVVYDQKPVWSKGFGYADVEKKTPATPSTIFSICSISKLFTSTAVMQLRDQGKLRLDDPIKQHLPWFNIKDKYSDAPEITIQAVLTHSAGLPREAAFPYWTGPEYPFPTREQMMETLSSQEELYPADTYYQYSNLGMSLLGEVVASASGQSFSDYVQQNILAPLGLKDTSTEMPEKHRGGRLATGYTMRMRDGSRKVMPFFQVRGIAPAAGFASTVEDLSKFASWQFRLLKKGGTEILAANTLKEMHRVHWLEPNFRTARGWGYSISNRNDKLIVGHNGSCPGYHTQLDMWPKDKVAVVVMSNGNDVRPGTYSKNVYDVIAPAIEDAVKNPDKAKKPDPTLAKYVGKYQRPLGGETYVLIVEGKFLRTFSVPTDNPSGRRTKLERVEGNIFQAVRDDEKPTTKTVFEIGPDGRVTRMIRNSNYSIRVY